MGGFFGVGEPGGIAAVGLGFDGFVGDRVGEVDAVVGLVLDGAEVDLGGLVGDGFTEVVVAGVGGDRFGGSEGEEGDHASEYNYNFHYGFRRNEIVGLTIFGLKFETNR